jgi:hypothetical protein
MRMIPIVERRDPANKPAVHPAHPASEPSPAASSVASSAAGKHGVDGVRGPRGIARVPTHTVGHASERRQYARACLALPLVVRSIAGRAEVKAPTLVTQDISSSGLFFLCPRRIEPGTPLEMEVTLVDNPLGRGVVRMRTHACIVRAEVASPAGWHGLAAAFDDITFVRDEPIPQP